MKKRIGFIGIVIENKQQVPLVNEIIGKYSDMITGKIGVPNQEDGTAVIGLIIRGTTDRVGAFTGRLGSLDGVVCKSALTSKETED
ncbi:MAG: CopG family transcriptional regulator [Eubacteriales bacterium]|nr:CopG family transcriptional regulator [Eubacteriales bacterium]MDD3882166.1 CopG family transcriptional regulator [Eubacteriales bacterium]MDD4513790.1 CopG family transcriptional regulator [Eubacteriales bacterium]